MKPKLEALVDDSNFGIGAINVETGVMVNQYRDMVDFIFLEFSDRFEVYLNIYDEKEPPFRNLLAKGVGGDLEEAKRVAVENLDAIAYKNRIH